jgi:hypothetical protein
MGHAERTVIPQTLVNALIERTIDIVITILVPRIGSDIPIDRIVSRFRYPKLVILQWLIRDGNKHVQFPCPPMNPLDPYEKLTFNPLSSSVRSSTLPAITSHLASLSAKSPLKAGLAAVKANMIGVTGTRASYTLLASFTFQAWKVIWRQQQPIPKAMASI